MRIIRMSGLPAVVGILWILAMGIAAAAPARKGNFQVRQPDGTTFMASLRGDEFMKIMTTASGHAVKQGADGWYYYAYYDDEGAKLFTDWKVGTDAPGDVLAKSQNIPYQKLNSLAGAKRQALAEIRAGKEPLMKRFLAQRAAQPGTKTNSSVAHKHGLIILVQFRDLSFTFSRDNFVAMVNTPLYSYNGADGSVTDYFNDQFAGVAEFTFDVSPVATLENNYAYYGGNNRDGDDLRPAEMVAEACRMLDDDIDFTLYDEDGDGVVDNVFVFFAGGDEAEWAGDDHIWSHSWYVYQGAGINLVLDGKQIDSYACTSELTYNNSTGRIDTFAAIGTFCHEFSHVLGLMDYYDTDYEESGGTADGMWGSLALMDSGNQNNNGNTPPAYNALDRMELGLSVPETITESGLYELSPITESGKFYRLDTEKEDEFFLLECREATGWDEYIGGSGLLIYHIDKSNNNAGYSASYGRNLTAIRRWENNEINCNPSHQCAYIVPANPSARSAAQVFYPYRTNDSFTPGTTPAFTYWSGSDSDLAITDITEVGNKITFSVSKAESPIILAQETYQDAAKVWWKSSSPAVAPISVVKLITGGKEVSSAQVESYGNGEYSITFEGLDYQTAYVAQISFENGGVVAEAKFTTNNYRGSTYSYMNLKYVNEKRNGDGSYPAGTGFPLRLNNALDAEEIRWFFDDKEVKIDASGYFVPEKSGTLKAKAYYEDGRMDVVLKEIVLK